MRSWTPLPLSEVVGEESCSSGSSDSGELLFLRIGERPLTHSLERGIVMNQPYECAEGLCQDVVSWSLSGVIAAMGITAVAVLIVAIVVEQVRRK